MYQRKGEEDDQKRWNRLFFPTEYDEYDHVGSKPVIPSTPKWNLFKDLWAFVSWVLCLKKKISLTP